MSVFRETSIEWDGQTYKFVPSMRLLRTIEQEISIMHTAASVAVGKPKAAHMAYLIACVMQAAGAKVTEDEIFAELSTGEAKQVMALYANVIEAISPTRADPKKADAAPE